MTEKVTKAVIPAAGFGTRLLPATKSQPKEMLPIVDKPVMQFVVEEAVASGLDDILIITGRDKRSIEDHFDFSPELEVRLERANKDELLSQVREIAEMANLFYIRQKEPRGLGDAIFCARKHVGESPFAVLLGDAVLAGGAEPCVKQLMRVHEETGKSVVAVERMDAEKIHRFGVIDGEETAPGVFGLRALVEKPARGEAPSDLAVAGRYLLTPRIFEYIESAELQKDGEIGITPALNRLAREEGLYAVLYDGRRYDIGDRLDYVLTTIAFAMRRPDIGGQVREHLLSMAEQIRAGQFK